MPFWRRTRKGKTDAHEVYDELADGYAGGSNTAANLEERERPAMRAAIGDVEALEILDAGCGPGWWVALFLAEGAVHVTGVDAAASMIDAARRRVGGDERADLRVHDLRDPLVWLPDESRDLVASSLVLAHLEDWGPPLREFYRLLRPGGRLVFSVEHPWAAFARPAAAGYFATERIDVRWIQDKGEARAPDLPLWRRPLHAMTDALLDAGFGLERVLEPQPTAAYADRVSEKRYRRACRSPVWIAFAAKKPG